jgi:putative copper resistance protein D
MDMGVPPFTWRVLLTTWHSNTWWDAVMVAALVAYIAGLVMARRRGNSGVPAYRVISFIGALLVVGVSLNTAIDTYSEVLFWVHMIQHLLLIMVAPALLVVGGPLTILVQATRGTTQGRVRGVLLSTPVGVVTHPLIGAAIYAIVIVATHLTSFMEQMMLHPWLHQAEHVLYLLGGYLFLLPLLGNEPIRWHPPYLLRLFVLFIAMAPETVVGIVLLQANHELFPAYAEVPRNWGPTPLHDLNRGGGIMWAFGDGLMMLLIVAVMVVYLAHSASNATAGGWLEGVRRSTLAANLEASGERVTLDNADLDSDDSALAAYNRMLARLNKQDGERPASR